MATDTWRGSSKPDVDEVMNHCLPNSIQTSPPHPRWKNLTTQILPMNFVENKLLDQVHWISATKTIGNTLIACQMGRQSFNIPVKLFGYHYQWSRIICYYVQANSSAKENSVSNTIRTFFLTSVFPYHDSHGTFGIWILNGDGRKN